MTPRRDFTLTWTLDSPCADATWTDPDHLGWFYNDEQPVPTEPIELDLRVGGVWRQHMVINESTAYFTGGVYREIVPDEKLVFAWGATGGWPELDPSRLDDSPLVTVTLSQAGGEHRDDPHRRAPAEHPRRPDAAVVRLPPGRLARHRQSPRRVTREHVGVASPREPVRAGRPRLR